MEFCDLLDAMRVSRASDAYCGVGVPPILRIDGALTTIGKSEAGAKVGSFDVGTLNTFLASIPGGDRLQTELASTRTARARVKQEGVAVQVFLFFDKGLPSVHLRLIVPRIPTLQDLGLPPIVEKATYTKSGLIVIAGRAGSGKTTTAYSMLNHINLNRSERIFTCESPQSYDLPHKMSLVTQQSIGVDVESYEDAVAVARRTEADVLLVDDLPTPSSAVAALQFAENGGLLVAVLPGSDVTEALETLIDRTALPRDVACRIVSRLLHVAIAQCLLPGLPAPRRIAVQEILLTTSAVRERLGSQVTDFQDVMSGEPFVGMQTMDAAVSDACRRGVISHDTALSRLRNPKLLPPLG